MDTNRHFCGWVLSSPYWNLCACLCSRREAMRYERFKLQDWYDHSINLNAQVSVPESCKESIKVSKREGGEAAGMESR